MATLVSNNFLIRGSAGALPVRRGYGLGVTTELLLHCCRANTDLTPKQLSNVDAVLDEMWTHCESFAAKYCRPTILPLPVSLKLTVGLPVLRFIMIAYLSNSLSLVYDWGYQLMVDQAVDLAYSIAYSVG